MNEFDIMTTATLRPELLKVTFDSHIENLFGDDIKKANLIINIDPDGHKKVIQKTDEILTYLDTIPFKSITINTPKKASFSQAFFWLLGRINGPLVFNLEEDWELTQKLDFKKMVELFENDSNLVHLRLSSFPSSKLEKLRQWNKWINWNGSYFNIPRDLRGTIGWAGHPSLNKASFLMFFRTILDATRNPEKQIKGSFPIILNSNFGVFHPMDTPAAIKDIGRQWMIDNGYAKKGIKAFFTEWEKTTS